MSKKVKVCYCEKPGRFGKVSPDKKYYTVKDVIRAGHNLEPLKCLYCGHIGEVTFYQYMGDAYYEMCGKWQLEDKEV
jgi:hypothetical protein